MSRETAWTPCGLDITGATSIEEALKKAELDFDVQKKNIYDEYGNAIPEWYRNVRSDNNSVLGIVSNKYKIVQNRDAFEFVNNLVDEGIEFEKGGVFHCGRAAWLEAKIPAKYNILGDDVETHLVFKNSHDGLGAVKVAVIPNRIACSNALNFAFKSALRTWSVVHSAKIDVRLQEAREALGLATTYMNELEVNANFLATQKMSDEEFMKIIDTIYPLDETASNRKKNNVLEIKNGLMLCLKADDLANFKGTKWEKAMALTDWVDHKAAARQTAGYEEARWESIIGGHRDVDKIFEAIRVA